MGCQAILVDRRNFKDVEPTILAAMKVADVVGFDFETHNEGAHEGIKEFRKDEDAKAFDWRQMTVTGFSMYPELNADKPVAYYFNLAHKDEENRLAWDEVKHLVDAKKDGAAFIAHNAPFEITVAGNSLGYFLPSVICTLQMAVSAWGPDEYNPVDYVKAHFGEMKQLFPDAIKLFSTYDIKAGKNSMTPAQAELFYKIIGKSSKSSFSYNGVIKEIAYGYGLKQIVKRLFGVNMTTYEEVIGDKGHMGNLTGEDVVAYGVDDAYWAVKVFYKIYAYMKDHCPDTIPTFFSQENPMIYVYSEVKQQGMRVNMPAIELRRMEERAAFAKTLRELKAVGRSLLPFPDQLCERLVKYDKWYAKGHEKYRTRLAEWLMQPDDADDFKMACQVSSPVSNAWAGDKCDGLSIGHYFQSRLLMYDLTGFDPIIYKGKVQSDAETRGEMKDKITKQLGENDPRVKLITLMGEIANIEQRMKLYLTPYLQLTDPVTGRMYPELSSMLATRRMSCSNPNAQQLAKRGNSTYVRGFYLADNDDELLVSIDWSQIELVIIGELSGDPAFARAYGQLPYQDLHIAATVSCLRVLVPELTEEQFRSMARAAEAEAVNYNPRLLVNIKGEPLTPEKAYKYWRTELGKKANFGYWYSGALSDVGESMGWTSDQMWEATEGYRQQFPVAEAWRSGTIESARDTGRVLLPDGHYRTKFECSNAWADLTRKMLKPYSDNNAVGLIRLMEEVMKATRSRAGNQLVNAKVQGTSAALTKRSILSIRQAMLEGALKGIRGRFKIAIHDELVYSIHRDDIIEFIHAAKVIMRNHPDIINKLKVDCTASIGTTFEPFTPKYARKTQIELDEAPKILDFKGGEKLNDDQIKEVINWIYEKEAA